MTSRDETCSRTSKNSTVVAYLSVSPERFEVRLQFGTASNQAQDSHGWAGQRFLSVISLSAR